MTKEVCTCPKPNAEPLPYYRSHMSGLFEEIEAEALMGAKRFGLFNSAHEGFAVLLEEVDELKAHVWAKQKNRNLIAMKREAIQVAAMAIRFALEVCDEVRGRK